MKKKLMKFGAAFFASLFMVQSASACTGVYVGKDLTTDGSVIFGRTEDLELNHDKSFEVIPEGTVPAGETVTNPSEDNDFTYTPEKDSVKYTATPDNPASEWGAYHEAGFNKNGVAMDATTTAYTRDEILAIDDNLDTGIAESIMTNAVLGQATSARHGVELLAKMIDENGAMESNGLIIADQKETWYMEIISGHQYAAMKLPDDMYAVFPNSLFIQSIDVNDTENYIASKDIEKVATEAGTIVRDEAGRINVAASYAAEMTLGTASRYWSGVKEIDPNATTPLDKGNLTATELKEMLPTIQSWPYLREMETPGRKISIEDVMAFQRNRLEGTEYIPADNAASATGAGDAQIKEDMALYPIGNKNTMEAHIFQIHQDMPADVPGAMWLAMGSPNTAPYLPYFGNITDTAASYKAITPDEHEKVETLKSNLSAAKKALRKNTDTTKTAELEKAIADAEKELTEYKNVLAEKSFYWASSVLLDEMLANEPERREEILAQIKNIESVQLARYDEMRKILNEKYAKDPEEAAKWFTELSICVADQAFADLKLVKEGKYEIVENKTYKECPLCKLTSNNNTKTDAKIGGNGAESSDSKTLPQTGENSSVVLTMVGLLSIVSGAIVLNRKFS